MNLPSTGLLDVLSTPVLLLDRELKVVYLNGAAEELIRCSVARATGRRLDQLLRDSNDLVEACRKVMEAGSPLVLREFLLASGTSDEGLPVDCTVGPTRGDVPAGLVVEIATPDEVRPMRRGESMEDRQQSQQTLIRGLAHEIRNPLGGIRGAAQLLAADLGDDSQREYTGVILRETDRLVGLVDRLQAGGLPRPHREVNVHGVLEHVRQLLEAESGRQLVIAQDYDPSLPPVPGDEEQLIQAVLNVTRNAMEIADGIPGIRFTTRFDHQFLPAAPGLSQVVRIDIADDGPGIEPALVDHVFDPMVTGRPGGTGLGLAITAEIVRHHHGRIDVRSEPGSTVFSIYLPFGNDTGAPVKDE